MKKITKYLAVAFCLTLCFTSCNKWDVSLDPTWFQTADFSTEAQLQNQLAAAYNILSQDATYGQGLWGYINAGTDESFRSGTTATTAALTQHYNIANDEVNVNTLWRHLYSGIERVNIIMNVADQPKMDDAKRTSLKGQAKFLRAYYYYLLVTHFGDVPLKTTLTSDMGIDFNLPRKPSKDIYAYILKEMIEAEAMVPTMAQENTTSRVTKSAVQAILARVCLSMAGNPINDETKYEEALFWAEKVIKSNAHSLNNSPLVLDSITPAYSKLFVNNMQNNRRDNNVTEGIWDASFLSKSAATGAYANLTYPVTQTLGAIMGVYSTIATPGALVGFSGGIYRCTPKLYKLYAPGDQRRDWAIAPYGYKDATKNKYYTLKVNITGPTGTGAAATAIVSNTGAITSVQIDNPGSGYTTATVSFTSYATNNTKTQAVTATANIATATATVSAGKITAITVTKGGSGYPTVGERTVGKWRREYELELPPVRLQNNTSCNFPIIRYADVLLIAAEADLKVNGTPSIVAVEYYNQVRRRAFGYDYRTPVPVFDVSTFDIQDIMDERSRELCFEGQRRNDLIRWGKMEEAMQNLLAANTTGLATTYQVAANLAANNFLSNPIKYKLLPIPAVERSRNRALTQNTGW